MRTRRMLFEPLTAAHAPLLHAALSAPAIYEHLDGTRAPSLDELTEEFATRAAGPDPARSDERWLNVAIRLDGGAQPYIGRLEATLHGDWAEVAYLLSPDYWGRGLAQEAMAWWHEVLARHGAKEAWAAVGPGNARSLRLLERLGYVAVALPAARALASFDAGDRVLRRRL